MKNRRRKPATLPVTPDAIWRKRERRDAWIFRACAFIFAASVAIATLAIDRMVFA